MDLPREIPRVIHIEEPELSFGHGQTCDHPKDGLFLYGPHGGPARSREVSVGVIGTKDGLSYFRNWAIASRRLRCRSAAQEDRQGEPPAPVEFSGAGRSVRPDGQPRRVCSSARSTPRRSTTPPAHSISTRRYGKRSTCMSVRSNATTRTRKRP